jgi:hypothetical protein
VSHAQIPSFKATVSKQTQHSYDPSRSSLAIISDCSLSDTPRNVVGDLIDEGILEESVEGIERVAEEEEGLKGSEEADKLDVVLEIERACKVDDSKLLLLSTTAPM